MPCTVPWGWHRYSLDLTLSQPSFDTSQGYSFWGCTWEEVTVRAHWDWALRAYCLLTQEVQMIDANKISSRMFLGPPHISSLWPPCRWTCSRNAAHPGPERISPRSPANWRDLTAAATLTSFSRSTPVPGGGRHFQTRSGLFFHKWSQGTCFPNLPEDKNLRFLGQNLDQQLQFPGKRSGNLLKTNALMAGTHFYQRISCLTPKPSSFGWKSPDSGCLSTAWERPTTHNTSTDCGFTTHGVKTDTAGSGFLVRMCNVVANPFLKEAARQARGASPSSGL